MTQEHTKAEGLQDLEQQAHQRKQSGSGWGCTEGGGRIQESCQTAAGRNLDASLELVDYHSMDQQPPRLPFVEARSGVMHRQFEYQQEPEANRQAPLGYGCQTGFAHQNSQYCYQRQQYPQQLEQTLMPPPSQPMKKRNLDRIENQSYDSGRRDRKSSRKKKGRNERKESKNSAKRSNRSPRDEQSHHQQERRRHQSFDHRDESRPSRLRSGSLTKRNDQSSYRKHDYGNERSSSSKMSAKSSKQPGSDLWWNKPQGGHNPTQDHGMVDQSHVYSPTKLDYGIEHQNQAQMRNAVADTADRLGHRSMAIYQDFMNGQENNGMKIQNHQGKMYQNSNNQQGIPNDQIRQSRNSNMQSQLDRNGNIENPRPESSAPVVEHDEKLERIEIFDNVDVFTAGTFKFERNIHHTKDIAQFEKDMLELHEANVNRSAQKTGKGQPACNMAGQRQLFQKYHLEKMKQEYKPQLKHIKTYVPIFPALYDNLENGQKLAPRKSLTLYGQQVIKVGHREELVHKLAQIKLSIHNNSLLKYEETREKQVQLQLDDAKTKRNPFSDYLCEINFDNIKTVWICKSKPQPRDKMRSNDQKRQSQSIGRRFNEPQSNNGFQFYQKSQFLEEKEYPNRKMTYLNIVIQLKKPCPALKFGPNVDFSEVTSTKQKRERSEEKKMSQIIDPAINFDAHGRSPLKSPAKNRSRSIIPEAPSCVRSKASAGGGPPSTVRSPFNMTSNLKSEVQAASFQRQGCQRRRDDNGMINYESLINYWNNNQVIHMAGPAAKEHVELFVRTLKKQNPKAKIFENAENIQDLGINFLDKEETEREVINLRQKGLQFADQLNQMKPSLRFSIMALLSQNKFNIFNQGLIDFMSMLNRGGWNSQDMTADFGAFVIDHINLFKELDYKDDSSKKIEELFTQLYVDQLIIDDFRRIQNQDNLIRQRRVLVTPSLFHFTVAREEESNKVLRQYKDWQTQFIRLSFVTEQLDKGYYFGERDRLLLGYIHSILKNGFYVGRSLKNEFLSYSNSQLKNHTCWYLSKVPNGIDEAQIIQSMGDFSQEKNVLKRYARRGQCFSTTKKVLDLRTELVCQGYPDIERNGHVFSDGCGLIHPDRAQDIARIFKFTNISAFQIRLGGAKGVLAVSKEQFENNQSQVILRKSQVKFPSDNLTLDIVRCATFSQGFLNRQIITLLHCLGVPIDYFLRKQQRAKQYISLESIQSRLKEKVDKIHNKFGNILSNQNQDFSLNYTIEKNKRLRDLAKDMKLSIEPCKSFQATLKQALIKGVEIMKDPVLSSILYSMQLNQFMNLKKKARILLPDSCVLIGIVDPTGILNDDEIFVQTRKDNFSIHKHGQGMKNRQNRMEQAETISSIDSFSEIIEGDVLVTRNPCTHPGDIRLLKCVDKPELRYLFNVVVFSSKGERPQCNMMSGGDLDGDVYFVTWDKELLSYVKPESIKEPADYSKSELIKEKPDSEDLADYFVFYLHRDVLGTVSNLWLMLCDKYGQDGPCNPKCISLSHMCSVAVDFAKHGECVAAKNYTKMKQEIAAYPDFLERATGKSSPSTFASQGVLGHLYRDIKTEKALLQFIDNEWQNSISLRYELDQNILDLIGTELENKVQMHKYLVRCYEKIVKPMSLYFKKIMMYFQLANEGELFACDLKFRLCHLLDQDDKMVYLGDPGSKIEDAISNLNTMKRQITEKFQGILNELIHEGTASGDANCKLNVSVALYLATYFDVNKSGIEYQQKFCEEKNFNDFLQLWKRSQEKPEPSRDSFLHKLRQSTSVYHQMCAEAEQGNQKKMRKLLQCKKLFCIPWLLVGETLLISYPDKYDSQEFLDLAAEMAQKTEQAAPRAKKVAVDRQEQTTMTKEQLKKLNKAQKLSQIFGGRQFGVKAQDEAEKENTLIGAKGTAPAPKQEKASGEEREADVEMTEAQFSPMTNFELPSHVAEQRNESSCEIIETLPFRQRSSEQQSPGFLQLVSSVHSQLLAMKLEESQARSKAEV